MLASLAYSKFDSIITSSGEMDEIMKLKCSFDLR